MPLINYTEKVLFIRLGEYIAEHPGEFCSCLRCVEDILAFALNRLPPRYVVSDKGEVLTDYKFCEPLDRTKVLTELIHAIHHVAKNPAHSESNPGPDRTKLETSED